MKINVNLNAKTLKKLDSATADRLRNVISNHLSDKPWEMERLLWNLTYNQAEGLKALGFDPETNAPNVACIRAEMGRYFAKVNPKFTYGRRFTPVTDAHKALNKALKGDQYAYDTVMSHIKERSGYSQEEIDKMLRCLTSQREPSQFGGIRMLGFRADEATYLKGAATQMGEVLKAMTNMPKLATTKKPAEDGQAPEA